MNTTMLVPHQTQRMNHIRTYLIYSPRTTRYKSPVPCVSRKKRSCCMDLLPIVKCIACLPPYVDYWPNHCAPSALMRVHATVNNMLAPVKNMLAPALSSHGDFDIHRTPMA